MIAGNDLTDRGSPDGKRSFSIDLGDVFAHPREAIPFPALPAFPTALTAFLGHSIR